MSENEKPQAQETGLTGEKALMLARESYSGSTSYFDANIRTRIEADIRRFQSRFPSGSKYLSEGYRARSRLFRPKTRSAIRKNEAVAAEAYFSTLDVMNIAPIDESNEEQAANAEVMKALMQHRLTKSIPWFITCIGAYQDAQVTGIAISHQYWDYNEKRKRDQPVCELIPIENFRFHPAAKWYDPVGTSPYLILLIPMYVKDVRARMDAGRWQKYEDGQIQSAQRNYDTTRLEREGNRTDSAAETNAETSYSIVWVHMNIVDWDDEDYVFYTLGEELLLSSPKKLEDISPIGRPFVVGQCVIETHRNYPNGPSALGAPVQDEINEVTNQRIDNVKFALNKRYFVARNKQVDLRSLTRNVPSSVTLMNNINEDVRVVETNDVTGSSYQEQDRLNMDYDDLAGVFSGASVASNRKLNETVGGMNILTSNSNQISNYQLKTFTETWVEPVLRQLIKLEQEFETDEIVVALAAKKAKLMQKFGIDEVTDELLRQELTMNVNVGMSATNPHDKVNSIAMGMGAIRTILADDSLEKYGLDANELIKEVLGALGYKDGGRFFQFDEQADPRIANLEQQISELQAALDAKHPKELVAAQVNKLQEEAKKVAAERVKTGVESVYSAMQGAQVVAELPQVSPIADVIMQTSGYTPPNPVGVDPNFPQPEVAIPEPVDFPTNTSPMLPASPATGQAQGIETQRADGVRP